MSFPTSTSLRISLSPGIVPAHGPLYEVEGLVTGGIPEHDRIVFRIRRDDALRDRTGVGNVGVGPRTVGVLPEGGQRVVRRAVRCRVVTLLGVFRKIDAMVNLLSGIGSFSVTFRIRTVEVNSSSPLSVTVVIRPTIARE